MKDRPDQKKCVARTKGGSAMNGSSLQNPGQISVKFINPIKQKGATFSVTPCNFCLTAGSPKGFRTPVSAVRGRCRHKQYQELAKNPQTFRAPLIPFSPSRSPRVPENVNTMLTRGTGGEFLGTGRQRSLGLKNSGVTGRFETTITQAVAR